MPVPGGALMQGTDRGRLVPTLRKGTVTAIGATTVNVDVEDSGVDAPMGWVCDGQPQVGDVVSCLWSFGTGVVIGPLLVDPWHTVGDPGEPGFLTGWQHTGGGTRKVGFRRVLDRVELCGAGATSAGSTNGTAPYTLPVGYRPDTNLRIGISANPSGSATNTAVTIFINGVSGASPGVIQIINFSGTVTWGSVGFEGIAFPLIGAV